MKWLEKWVILVLYLSTFRLMSVLIAETKKLIGTIINITNHYLRSSI